MTLRIKAIGSGETVHKYGICADLYIYQVIKMAKLPLNEYYLTYKGKKLDPYLKIKDYPELSSSNVDIIYAIKSQTKTEKAPNYYGRITGFENDPQYQRIAEMVKLKLHEDEWIICSVIGYLSHREFEGCLTLVTNYGSFFFYQPIPLSIGGDMGYHIPVYYEGIRRMPEYMIDVVQHMFKSSAHCGSYGLDDTGLLKEHTQIRLCSPMMCVGNRTNPFISQQYIENTYKFIRGIVERIAISPPL
jgi:hypothetical protein